MTVTDSLGIVVNNTVTVAVNDVPPTVSIIAPPSGTTGTAVSFTASAIDNSPELQAAGFTYQWTFGDGGTATGPNPTHTYALDALYTVITLTATDVDGQAGTGSTQINVFRPGFQGNTTATYYNLTPPSSLVSGIGIPSGSFTIGLPNGRYVASPVTVTPNDGGEGGTFTPSSVTLSNASPTATFTYTPANPGSITIATTNNGGLNNPAPTTFTSQSPVSTYTLSGPASGTVATATTFTLTLGPGWLTNPVVITPAASNGDGTFSPTSITLNNSNRSATFTYTPTLYDQRNIVVTNNGNLTNSAPFAFLSEVQLGSSGTAPSGDVSPDLGGYNFFADGAWWEALGSSASDYGIAPNSAALMSGFGSDTLQIFLTTTANGGNSLYGLPYNVVPANQPLVPTEPRCLAAEYRAIRERCRFLVACRSRESKAHRSPTQRQATSTH